MGEIRIILEGDNCWPDLMDRGVLRVGQGIQIARLRAGMKSGRSSISIRADIQGSNTTVLLEISMDNFLAAASAMRAAEEKDRGTIPPVRIDRMPGAKFKLVTEHGHTVSQFACREDAEWMAQIIRAPKVEVQPV